MGTDVAKLPLAPVELLCAGAHLVASTAVLTWKGERGI
uniref:Uncharacterized protein n=1 Tax=Arundo donax TaxID=35708 RepID=A0A0A9A5X6_ARUDO